MLTALLNFLCPEDPDEAGRLYNLLHSKLTGYFRSQGMSDPEGDADETFDRANKSIEKGKEIPNINNFCMGIARNIVRERKRDKRRQQSAFQKFLDNSQDKSTEALVHWITKLMKPCFEKLSEDERNLLISYCKAPAGMDLSKWRLQLAESRNSSLPALRIRVARLRRRLDNCVKRLANDDDFSV